MNRHADKVQENKSQSVVNAVSQENSSSESTLQFKDNRPEAVAQRKLQERANNSSQAMQLRAFQDKANDSPQVKQAAQLQAYVNNIGTVVQMENGGKNRKRWMQEEMDHGHDDYLAAQNDAESEGASEEEMQNAYEEFMADPSLGTSYLSLTVDDRTVQFTRDDILGGKIYDRRKSSQDNTIVVVFHVGDDRVEVHDHPGVSGGAYSINRQLSLDNVPRVIVDAIREHPGYQRLIDQRRQEGNFGQ